MSTADLLHLLDLLGVAVFAASGALVATRRGLDLVGVAAIATVTALGGGTIRDLLLDRHPIFWIDDPISIWTSLGAAGATLCYVRLRPPPERALLVADALGLALFSITGARVAQAEGWNGLTVVVMGTLTGVAGGVIRDTLTAQVPLILRGREFYASAAIAGITTYLLLGQSSLGRPGAALSGVVVVVALRLGAIFRGLLLPHYE